MKVQTGNSAVSPRVDHIATALEARIRSREYPDGRWLPSERQIAQEFGVSQIVVRSAIRELERRNLLVRAPRCRPIVQNVFSSRSPVAETDTRRRNLGLWIWPSLADPVASSIIQGIYRRLDHDSFRVIVGHAIGESWEAVCESEERFLWRMAQDRDIEGLLLWYLGGHANLPALQAVRAAGIPMVFLDREPPAGFGGDAVGVDNEHAAEQVVSHLLAQGHEWIAHLTNQDQVSTVAERFAGYRRALNVAGIPFRPELVLTAAEPTPRGSEKVFDLLVEQLFGLPNPPTAVFAVNDVTALNLLAALRARGVQVPEEIAVAGFDGIERWMPGDPFLTTVNQPFERLGMRAVDLLLRQIEAGPAAPYQHVMLEAPLSLHDSTRAQSRDEGVSMAQPLIAPYLCSPPACVDLDPRAARAAERSARLITARLPMVTVEHIGSTAVPHCAGKGVIDLIVVYPPGQLEVVKEALAELGFQRQTVGHILPEERPMRIGTLNYEGRAFRLHVHVLAADSPEIADLRAFRDRLRTDPDLVATYVARKREIIAAGATDPAVYTRMKSSFIQDVLASLKSSA